MNIELNTVLLAPIERGANSADINGCHLEDGQSIRLLSRTQSAGKAIRISERSKNQNIVLPACAVCIHRNHEDTDCDSPSRIKTPNRYSLSMAGMQSEGGRNSLALLFAGKPKLPGTMGSLDLCWPGVSLPAFSSESIMNGGSLKLRFYTMVREYFNKSCYRESL